MTHTRHLLAVALAFPLSAWAEGSSPWLPIPGQLLLGVNHAEQSAKNAYIGTMKVPVIAITGGGATTFKRSTTTLRLGYGISDSLAIDASLGVGRVKVGAADSDSGVIDSVVGLSWRVLDEFERAGLPTVTLRGAAIINGGYDGARLAALGNDASGVELALLVGKELTSAFSLWGEVGVQKRTNDVPLATFVEVGARYRVIPALNVNLGFTSKKYGGDLDIGGPGFTPARFQQVRAERSLVKVGVGYAIAGNQGIALNVSSVLSGRNTVKDDRVAGVSYTFGF